MSRALQTLVGLASVAQPTAVVAESVPTFDSSGWWWYLSEFPQPQNAQNLVSTTLVGTGENPSSNPFALIGLNSYFNYRPGNTIRRSAAETVFFIDYKIRPAAEFNLESGATNHWKESKVTIQAPIQTPQVLLSVSPQAYDSPGPSRMDNVNDEVPGGITFSELSGDPRGLTLIDLQGNNPRSTQMIFDPVNGKYSFTYGYPNSARTVNQVITNEIAGFINYDPDTVLAITFTDIFWPSGGNGSDSKELKYETTFYYNPTQNTLLTGPNGTQTHGLDVAIQPVTSNIGS